MLTLLNISEICSMIQRLNSYNLVTDKVTEKVSWAIYRPDKKGKSGSESWILDIFKMQWIIYRPGLHNLQTRRKKFKRVASGCKWSFCQSKKYLQIWSLPKFPIMSKNT